MSEVPTVLCPRCERRLYTPYRTLELDDLPPPQRLEHLIAAPFPALSRMDNETYICSWCGTAEALRDFVAAPPVSPSEWPVGAGE